MANDMRGQQFQSFKRTGFSLEVALAVGSPWSELGKTRSYKPPPCGELGLHPPSGWSVSHTTDEDNWWSVAMFVDPLRR
jgi:hypothetical protein